MAVIESTVAGRYRLISHIASGGMGEVYRAHDGVLGREVAIKVLHPQLAGDPGFVERFRKEARAAALLNHQNIVGVYDWGTTGGTPFMVMEFVRGPNLRQILLRYGRLEPARAVAVSAQVLDALDHAHRQGIVHRDVKPENILIAQDGNVKVTDFGLARAFADSTVSHADGAVIGTVQYLAPEQIQGRPADPRTDLYAAGVVLYELLVGRVPFSGETSLAIAYAHLSRRVPPPSSAAPGVTSSLDRVVLRATQKNPADRPASARAMKEEMARSAQALPTAPAVAELVAAFPEAGHPSRDSWSTVTIPRTASRRRRSRRRMRAALAMVALVLVVAAGVWAAWVYAVPHYSNVPRVRGLAAPAASARLRAAGLIPRLGTPVPSMSVEPGSVVRTVPSAGSRLQEGSEVLVLVSKGPPLLSVPYVVGDTEVSAVQALREAGFRPRVTHAYDNEFAQGRVTRQRPEAGMKVQKGSVVMVTVSRGPPPVRIPDVRGQRAAEGAASLESTGLGVERANQHSGTVPRDYVIRTEPAAGASVASGSVVTMVVSLGPESFPMPDVTGMRSKKAERRLARLGLSVDTVALPGVGSIVIYQFPEPGALVHEGEEVTLYVAGG